MQHSICVNIAGHIAAALDENRMFIFGGRGVGGRILNDSWVYNYDEDRWTLIQYNEVSAYLCALRGAATERKMSAWVSNLTCIVKPAFCSRGILVTIKMLFY